MKLYIEGDIGRYYVQTLCLIFFPGSKFPEDEEADEQTDVVSVKLADELMIKAAEALSRNHCKSCLSNSHS